MLFDGLSGDEKTQTSPLVAFGRKKEREQIFPGFFAHADAVVPDLQLEVGLAAPCAEDDLVGLARFVGQAGLNGILQNIDQGRAQGHRIGFEAPQLIAEPALKIDLMFPGLGANDKGHIVDKALGIQFFDR